MNHVLMLVMLVGATTMLRAQDTDTIPTRTSSGVNHVWRDDGVYYAIRYKDSGAELHRRTISTSWKRLFRAPRIERHRVFTTGDTIVLSLGTSLARSTDAGQTWRTSTQAVSSDVLIGSGRIAIVSADVDRLGLVDLVTNDVAYVDLPGVVLSLGPQCIVVDGDRTAWLGMPGPDLKYSILRIDSVHLPVDRVTVKLVQDADALSMIRTGGAGVWRASTLRADDDPLRSMTVPFDPAVQYHPLDVLRGQGAWWYTVASGLYRSSDGVSWQRQLVPRMLIEIRCWELMGDTMVVTSGSRGPYLWKIGEPEVTDFSQGLGTVYTTDPLLAVGDRVMYAYGADEELYDGIMAWGDEEPAPTPLYRRTGSGPANMYHVGGRLLVTEPFTPEVVVIDPQTMDSVWSYAITNVLDVSGMDGKTVFWRVDGLYTVAERDRVPARIVEDLDDEDRPIGIIGLGDRVLVIYLRAFADDRRRLTVRAFDSTGTEIIGDRLITELDVSASTMYMRMLRIGTSAVVWMRDALYVSDDGGISWVRRPVPFTGSTWPSVVDDVGMVWSTDEQGMWQTTDVGRTWTHTVVPLELPRVYSIVSTEQNLHLLTEDHLLRVPRTITNVQHDDVDPKPQSVALLGSVLHVLLEAPYTVRILDMQGRVVAEGTGSQMDLRNVANGLYHCVVATDRGTDVTSVLIHGR